MGNKLLRVLRNVLIFFIALITVGLIFLVCYTGPFIAVWIFAVVGLVACIFCKCIHLGIHSVFKENLPDWYIASTFRNKLRISCFAVSLILFFVSVTVYGRMSGYNTVMGSLGAVVGTVEGITGKIIGKSIAHIGGVNADETMSDTSEPPDQQESPTATVEKPIDAEQLYAPILEKYRAALSQGYDRWQLQDAGLNYLCAYYDDDVSQIGYVFLDIDQNGTPELLIGDISGEDYFFDYYTVIEGTPILVAQSSERNRYYLCADGVIANEASNSAFNSFNAYYTVGAQGQLILLEAVILDEDYSSDNAWYSTSTVSAEGASPLSWESAELIYKKHEYVRVDYTSFFPNGSPKPAAPEPVAEEPAGTSGKYDDIMGTYIDENYNGIYMFIGYGDSSKTTAYVALALAIDDFSVEIQDREGSDIYATDFDESISSEPGYIVDLDCSQPGKIVASIYINEYDYSEDIAFVPYPDAAYSNPYYVD